MSKPPKPLSLLIKGAFSEDDLRELTAAFRKIERRRPGHSFWFTIIEADLSMAEGEALVKRLFPRIDDDEPIIRKL